LDLLAQDINTITFQDVVEFCDQQIVESTELDYKQILPRDLTKHFAAMSNRFGGLIIGGVEEDPQTGLPSKYEGLVNDGKLIDRVHQFANNVRPLPSYHVRTTEEVGGKVFLLIRISEGGAPPYTPKNDPTVYLRTGNITTPLERADVDIVRDLYAKRASAAAERRDNVARADARLRVRLEQAGEGQRPAAPAREGAAVTAMPEPEPLLPEKLRFLTSYLQPFYPRHELTQPRAIFAKLNYLRVMYQSSRIFPSMQMQPITRGMFSFERRRQNLAFSCDQIYANGLFMHSESLARPWSDRGDDIFLAHIARNFYMTLLFGCGLYNEVGYSGLTRGALVLERASGATVQPIRPKGWRGIVFDSDLPKAIDDTYSWPIEADTHQLSDDDWVHTYFYERMREICWDLGVEDVARATMDEYIRESAFNR